MTRETLQETLDAIKGEQRSVDPLGVDVQSTVALFHRLEQIESERGGLTDATGSTRWMIPYADLLTLLLGLFMVLYLTTQEHNNSLIASIQGRTAVNTQSDQLTLNPYSQAQAKILSPDEAASFLMRSTPEVESATLLSQKVIQNPNYRPSASLLDATTEEFAELAKTFFEQYPDVSTRQTQEGLVISLKEGALFSPGEDTLTDNAKLALDQLSDVLKAKPHFIRVEGHTDNTPIATSRFPSNWELSTARATTILRYLVNQHGFSPSQLSAVGYGEFRPIAENSSIEGKQKNRRVDIVVLNNLMKTE